MVSNNFRQPRAKLLKEPRLPGENPDQYENCVTLPPPPIQCCKEVVYIFRQTHFLSICNIASGRRCRKLGIVGARKIEGKPLRPEKCLKYFCTRL